MDTTNPKSAMRRAVETDLEALAGLIHRAFAAYRTLQPPPSALSETPEGLRRALQRGPAFLVEDVAMPCACIFAEDRLDRLYLGRLAVAPDARRRGLARALLEEAEGYARSVGAPLMELNVRIALSDNIRLFQRAGFAITEQRSHPGFTIPTYYVMEKRLD